MTIASQKAGDEVAQLAQTYFAATSRRDLDAMEACWEPGGIENIGPVGELRVPGEYRAYFEEVFTAFPDFEYEVLALVTEGNRVAVHWRAQGTFTGGPYQGLEPNGRSGSISGIDMLEVADGRIRRNDVYFDSAAFMRQLGVLPDAGSTAERATKWLVNLRTKAAGMRGR